MSVRILTGDVRDMLATLPSDSVDCVVTSPPYWGLRDYGVAGQIGLEPTLGEHLAVMLDVFRDVRRVLKPAGTLWLNYGDCYATKPNGRKAADVVGDDRTFRDKPFSTVGGVLKPKDLCMIPNRLAIALQEDGWWVRSEIIWGKANPMPDTRGRQRPSTAHEKIFLLSKTAHHFYDAEAVAQPVNGGAHARRPVAGGWAKGDASHAAREFQKPGAARVKSAPKASGRVRANASMNGALAKAPELITHRFLRNYEPAPLQAWGIASQAFGDAHFATFPPELAERCILAGCPAGGVVLDPFGGAGTTGMVAWATGRSAILIELNPEYVAMAEKRIAREKRGKTIPLSPDTAPPVTPKKAKKPVAYRRRAAAPEPVTIDLEEFLQGKGNAA